MTARILLLTAGLLALGGPRPPVTFEPVPGLSRLRILDARTADVVRLGLDKSSTVRALVAEVEAGRDFVYVGIDDAISRCLSARMTLMGVGGSHRYVRISLRRDLTMPDAVAALAHELHHVRELRAHPEVRDDVALAALYRRIGHRSVTREREQWDTVEANRIGLAVRRELAPAFTLARSR